MYFASAAIADIGDSKRRTLKLSLVRNGTLNRNKEFRLTLLGINITLMR